MDADAKSVARQIENVKAYAERKGWAVSEDHVYADDGISGAEFVKRPGLARRLTALDQRLGVAKDTDHCWGSASPLRGPAIVTSNKV